MQITARAYNCRMDGDRRRRNVRSFIIGGLLGSMAGAVAAGRVRMRARPPRATPAGLAAFEQSPCYRELVERETGERAA